MPQLGDATQLGKVVQVTRPHLLQCSHAYMLAELRTPKVDHLLSYPSTCHSLTPTTHLLIHLCESVTHASTHSPTNLSLHSPTHQPIHPPTHPLTRSIAHSLTRSFDHSLTLQYAHSWAAIEAYCRELHLQRLTLQQVLLRASPQWFSNLCVSCFGLPLPALQSEAKQVCTIRPELHGVHHEWWKQHVALNVTRVYRRSMHIENWHVD